MKFLDFLYEWRMLIIMKEVRGIKKMKKLFMTVAALATLCACSTTEGTVSSETPISSETPVASEVATTSAPQEYATVLEAFQAGWASADDPAKGFLVFEGGEYNVRHFSDEETLRANYTELASACEGVASVGTIDEQIELRVAQNGALREGVDTFIEETTFNEGSERAVSDDELITRFDLTNGTNRFTMGIYTDGTVRVKNVMTNATEWYSVPDVVYNALSELMNENYVVVSEENADRLTCWESLTLGE